MKSGCLIILLIFILTAVAMVSIPLSYAFAMKADFESALGALGVGAGCVIAMLYAGKVIK